MDSYPFFRTHSLWQEGLAHSLKTYVSFCSEFGFFKVKLNRRGGDRRLRKVHATFPCSARGCASQGYAVAFSEWNSSPLVRADHAFAGSGRKCFTPTTFSLNPTPPTISRRPPGRLTFSRLLQAGAIVLPPDR